MDIIADYSDLVFVENEYFAYDAAQEVVNFDTSEINTQIGKLSLLHEIAHAKLGHFQYGTDFELLLMEIDAWHLTRQLASRHKVKIDEVFIDQCIATYDNWLNARSTCPSCDTFCLELGPHVFHCFMCGTEWQVNKRRDCRPIRKIISK